VSEFSILNGAFEQGNFVAAALFLVFLLVVFIGMGKTVLKVVQGRPPAEAGADAAAPDSTAAPVPPYRDGLLTVLPLFGLAALVLLLGLYVPAPLRELLDQSVACLEALP
jgi:hydrogenase-4 component F